MLTPQSEIEITGGNIQIIFADEKLLTLIPPDGARIEIG